MKILTNQHKKFERKRKTKEFLAHLRLENIRLDACTKKLIDDFDNSPITPEDAIKEFYTKCNDEIGRAHV